MIDVDAEADARVPANDIELASLSGAMKIEDGKARLPGETVVERHEVRIRAVDQGDVTGVGPLENVE